MPEPDARAIADYRPQLYRWTTRPLPLYASRRSINIGNFEIANLPQTGVEYGWDAIVCAPDFGFGYPCYYSPVTFNNVMSAHRGQQAKAPSWPGQFDCRRAVRPASCI